MTTSVVTRARQRRKVFIGSDMGWPPLRGLQVRVREGLAAVAVKSDEQSEYPIAAA
jgi:hypothetical protein